MPDDRSQRPRRAGAGRRPPLVAGHRRRPGADGAPEAAESQVPEATDAPGIEDTDVPGTEDTAPRGSGAKADPAGTSAPAAAEDEPTRFRVADTGWPPQAGTGGAALPRRTPGATGGPGGSGTTGPDETSAGGETVRGSNETASPSGPAGVRAGWVTSPPLSAEPWAGLPEAAGAATEPDAETDVDPGADPETGPTTARANQPAVEPESEPVTEPATEPSVDPATEPSVDPATGAGRHRGQRGRHGRPSRLALPSGLALPGRRGRPEAAVTEAAVTEAAGTEAAVTEPSPVDDETAVPDAGGVDTPADSDRALPAGRRLTWPAARLVVLALAIVAALVFGVLDLVTRVWPGPPANPYTSSSTKAAVAAATAVAPPILSYDYTTIDQKAAKLAPLQTSTCATQYAQLISSTVKPLAVQNKATQQATVLAAGVTSARGNAVTVLAFMQLTSTNSVKTGKAINEAQISLSMVKQHGRWLLQGTSANGASGASTPSCGGAAAQ